MKFSENVSRINTKSHQFFFFGNFSFLDIFFYFFRSKIVIFAKKFRTPTKKKIKNNLKLKNSKNKKLVALRIRSGNISWIFQLLETKTVGGDRFCVWCFFRFCVLIFPPDTPKVEIFFWFRLFSMSTFKKTKLAHTKYRYFKKRGGATPP